MPQLDHLVYAVPDLDAACAAVAKNSGVTPTAGGVHPGRGTHNALVGLAGGAYLELIAAHPTEPHGPNGRWMGVDLVIAPTLTRWAIRGVDVAAFAKTLRDAGYPQLARLAVGQRRTPGGQTLRWHMTEPQPAPAVEVIPFALDWSESEAHPADGLASEVTLETLRLERPEAGRVGALFARLGLSGYEIAAGPVPRISATFRGPGGTLTL